jgi:peptidylprolyl isomerase
MGVTLQEGAAVRIATTLLVSAGLIVSLAACSSPQPDPVATDCDVTPSGAASESVEVSGELGSLPVVAFDAPLTAEATERSVVIDGDGETVKTGDTVQVQYSILNGGTAINVAGTDYTEATLTDLPVDEAQFLPGIVKTLECSTVGSRVVGVIPPADAFGEAGSSQLGIEPDQSMVFVVDIVGIKEPLVPGAWTEDVPEVTFAEDGTPVVTLPSPEAPTELLEAVLVEGDGEVVEAGQTVTIDYQGTNWATGEVFDQSYGKEPLVRPTSIYVPGFQAALVGQKIGSTVIVTIPPEYGYGTEPTSNGLGGETLVFVIHIIA